MRAVLRPAHLEAFDYCARLYFAGMETIIKELNLNMHAQIANLRQGWDVTRVGIITLDGADIGWMQSFVEDNALFLAQLFVDGQFQRRGIGTEVVKALIGGAARMGLALTLVVVKTNPALRSTSDWAFASLTMMIASTCGTTVDRTALGRSRQGGSDRSITATIANPRPAQRLTRL
jgi:GNAT superfamily N-acetyltransferase